MKTLDEVITTLDGCFLKSKKDWCIENCPYLQNNEQTCRRDVLVDALDYLKEYYYRDKKLRKVTNHVENVCMQYICMIEELNKNEPLTWDELRTMEGKPIWLEWYDHKEWFLIDSIDKKKVVFRAKSGFRWHCIRRESETWQAYRKERE